MNEFFGVEFECYLEAFKKDSKCFVSLMKILDDEITGQGLPPVSRVKELFFMTEALNYHVCSAYRDQKLFGDKNESK